MSFVVVRPGLYSLIVDLGSPHTRHLGIPLGGAADRQLYQLGNAILDNNLNATALEVTQTGPILAAQTAMACVFMGEWFTLQILNRGPVTPGISFQLQPGDELQIGATSKQMRGYLCVSGGFQIEQRMGSCTAWAAIRTGDCLNASPSLSHRYGIRVDSESSDETAELRILPGSQYDWLEEDLFVQQQYTIAPTSNRMGIRLSGESLKRRVTEMVSEPVAPGTIQLTNDGQLIILGIDCQTIGGYPKVAHVIAADLDKLAQLRPNCTVNFVWVDQLVAFQAWEEQQAELNDWCVRLKWYSEDKTA